MAVRFQCFLRDSRWGWRLLGSNNRPLARSPGGLDDLPSALHDAAQVAALAVVGDIELQAEGHAWRWRLVDHGVVRAVAAIAYARRPDCWRAAERFREQAARAAVMGYPLVTPHLSA